jgi:hypothetical protein
MSILPDGFFERNDGKSYVDPEQQELARKVINSFPVYPRSYDRPFVGDASLGADGALLCFCGDPRSDHPDDGPCRLNGLGHGMPSDAPENHCHAYRADK